MGTGSRGGGSGGGGSGARGGGGFGGYRFENGRIKSEARPLNEVEKLVTKIFSDPNRRDYILRQFTNPLVQHIYEHLFALQQQLSLNRSWTGIQREYGIEDKPGCLMQWAETVFKQFTKLESDQIRQDVVWGAMKNYLSQMLGNNIRVYMTGTGTEIASRVDARIMERTSNNFLAGLIREVVKRETELCASTDETQVQLGEVSNITANRIVRQFEEEFRDPPKLSYRNLFTVIDNNPKWFLKALRR